MTRFARAKGSKSSNERTPEDSTPWEVMKEQLLRSKQENDESKKRQEAEQQRIDNYENFLKERKVQKRKATWCDFPESDIKKDSASTNEKPAQSKKLKKSKSTPETTITNGQGPNKNGASIPAEVNQHESNSTSEKVSQVDQGGTKKKKGKKWKQPAVQDDVNITTDVANQQNEISNKSAKIKKSETELAPKVVQSPNTEKTQVKKNKKNKSRKQSNNVSTPEELNTTREKNKKIDDIKEHPKDPPHNGQNMKKKKLMDGKPVRRKEINDRSFQLIVNGKDIELIRFDGFPIMKKDAERLQELKDSMIKKGIPKSEVQRTIKLERRRAEKALARLKRDVCYNCRKGGHVLSDCPELKSKIPGVDAAEGVCFKCGSTEHRQFECKVQKDKGFRFATCFICKEPGHIARQCPDNPKGLYPNGGSCKVCGDVTHLRKDCPTTSDKKEESNIKLHTLDATENIEDVENKTLAVSQETSKKPKKIKF